MSWTFNVSIFDRKCLSNLACSFGSRSHFCVISRHPAMHEAGCLPAPSCLHLLPVKKVSLQWDDGEEVMMKVWNRLQERNDAKMFVWNYPFGWEEQAVITFNTQSDVKIFFVFLLEKNILSVSAWSQYLAATLCPYESWDFKGNSYWQITSLFC